MILTSEERNYYLKLVLKNQEACKIVDAIKEETILYNVLKSMFPINTASMYECV